MPASSGERWGSKQQAISLAIPVVTPEFHVCRAELEISRLLNDTLMPVPHHFGVLCALNWICPEGKLITCCRGNIDVLVENEHAISGPARHLGAVRTSMDWRRARD